MAFNQHSADMRDADNGDFTNYAGRMMIGAFNPTTVSFDWLMEQEEYFGHAGALVYKNYCATCANLFVGGSNDWSHITDNGQDKRWTLAIVRMNEDGTTPANSVFHINVREWLTNES